MQFLPPDRTQESWPCHHIPLNSSGETLDSLYRWGHKKSGSKPCGLGCARPLAESNGSASPGGSLRDRARRTIRVVAHPGVTHVTDALLNTRQPLTWPAGGMTPTELKEDDMKALVAYVESLK